MSDFINHTDTGQLYYDCPRLLDARHFVNSAIKPYEFGAEYWYGFSDPYSSKRPFPYRPDRFAVKVDSELADCVECFREDDEEGGYER